MDKAAAIIAGLGGADNIGLEPCVTSPRTAVRDGSRVSGPALKAAGAHGVTTAGTAVRIVVGPKAEAIWLDIEDLH
jgi:PTS system N-acetylglucosamine-specific IIB component